MHKYVQQNIFSNSFIEHWASSPTVGLVKSSSLNIIWFFSRLSSFQKRVISTDCQGRVHIAFFARANKRWKGDISLGFLSLFYLKLFFSPSLLHLRPRGSLTMKWPALKCSPLLWRHLAAWLSLHGQQCWWGNSICSLWRTLQVLPMCVVFKRSAGSKNTCGTNNHILQSRCHVLWIAALLICALLSWSFLDVFISEAD